MNREKIFNYLFFLLLTVILLSLASCARVLLTDRMSLNFIPQQEMLKLSLQQYSDVLKESRLSTDTRKIQMVKKVGSRIAEFAKQFLRENRREDQLKDYEWDFNLIEDDKTINAWCMPGGKVAVYTGILPITIDETGLAVVIGHEVAHAIANHGNERMSQSMLINFGGVALSAALADKSAQTRELFMAAFGIGSNLGIMLPYSRAHESEADHIGLILMARAGYDPHESILFWQRMNAKSENRPLEFLSTHPAPESRIRSLKNSIDDAMPYYIKGQ